ncbi:molecular chaperone (plasmid) [Enterobacter hormaechei]|uniref:fimbrial biogenesis chaperone n=1 Tax=Enterobacter ludwigii TaxID=299767 RepID=UPI001BE09D95|nr:molecular chaperone [Enterobacter ludwigii]MBT1850636.1 molecular chaperone [Enterobacter ludwigii]
MKVLRTTLLTGLLFAMAGAHAGVVVGGTRLVYDGAKKESSLSVNNPDKNPYLIQSWIDTPDGGTAKAPFIITPPLFRLDGEQQNVLRVVRAGNLPEDKESLYWLNVKAIPSGSKQGNTLQIAVRTRIKLIYRPSALKGSAPEDQTDKLVWSRSGSQLQVKNPTSYYMNFNEITVGGKKLDNVTYVAPGATASFPMPAGGNAVSWKIISDYGAIGPAHKASL